MPAFNLVLVSGGRLSHEHTVASELCGSVQSRGLGLDREWVIFCAAVSNGEGTGGAGAISGQVQTVVECNQYV